ncbi:MAG: MFS transporter [Phycisphaerae bacterium]
MSLTFRLLLITFIESFATICVERGVYFYSKERLGFSPAENLWMALGLGAMYVVGATASHGLSLRFRERMVLLVTIAGQMAVHLAMAGWPVRWMLFAGSAAIGLLNGAKWPVLESYISAGKAPLEQAKAIGRFNISWALAVPLSIAAAGPMIAAWESLLFVAAAAMNLACIALSWLLAARPEHLAEDHEARPTVAQIDRLKALLLANRWLMLASYSLMFLLAPLLPEIFESLSVDSQIAPGLSGLMDCVRLAAFVVLGAWAAWHGRTYPVAWSLAAMPVGFFMILFGGNVAVVLAGEAIFGLAAGAVYYGALYYAMVVKNASVAGGGAHEGLIGLGFFLGPGAGLLAILVQGQIQPAFARMFATSGAACAASFSKIVATAVCVGPILIACSVAALWPLYRARRLSRR